MENADTTRYTLINYRLRNLSIGNCYSLASNMSMLLRSRANRNCMFPSQNINKFMSVDSKFRYFHNPLKFLPGISISFYSKSSLSSDRAYRNREDLSNIDLRVIAGKWNP